jgi:hypothetical protein
MTYTCANDNHQTATTCQQEDRSGASAAQLIPVREDLGSILTQTQTAFSDIFHFPSFRPQALKRTHSLVMSC